MRDRPNRSDHYQYIIHEISVSDEFLGSFTNAQSTGAALDPFAYNEEVDELREELRKEFWKLVDKYCTDRQKQICHMIADGKTQMEMAKELDVNQSSITKSINGNLDYNKGRRVYGGLIKKIKKKAEETPRIQEILARLNEIVEEKI